MAHYIRYVTCHIIDRVRSYLSTLSSAPFRYSSHIDLLCPLYVQST